MTNLSMKTVWQAGGSAPIPHRPVDGCYYAAFAIYSFFHLFEATNYDYFLGVETSAAGTAATALMLLLLLPRLFSYRYSLKSFCAVSCLVILGAIVYASTGSWIALSLALFICAGYGIDIRKLVLILLITTSAVFAIAVLGVHLNAIETVLSQRPGEDHLRDSCGFAQVNSVGFVAARICTALIVLRWGKSPALSTAVSVAAVILVDIVANSRTSEFYILVLAAANLFFYRQAKSSNATDARKALKACLGIIVAVALASWLLMLFFDPGNNVMMSLSELLSNRLYSSWYIFENNGISLFGNELSRGATLWTGQSYALETLDNAWVQWLVTYGVVPTAVLLAGFVLMFKTLKHASYFDGYVLALALLGSLFAFCESSALSFDMNPFLVMLSIPVFADSNLLAKSTRQRISAPTTSGNKKRSGIIYDS